MHVARASRMAIELVLVAVIAALAALGVRLGLLDAPDVLPPSPALARPTTPDGPRVGPLADYALIAERDIFNADSGLPAATTAEPSDLRLWGVALHGRVAHAVIEDVATGRQTLHQVGDTIGAMRVVAIDWDAVTLEGPGGRRTLALEKPPAPDATAAPAEGGPPDRTAAPPGDRIRQTGENAWLVDRREIAGAAGNMSGLLTQLRAVAEVRDGEPAGFRLFRIDRDGLFARLGLRDGDVVERVNGDPVTEPAALLGFLERLGAESRVALDIVRAGAPRTLVYDLR